MNNRPGVWRLILCACSIMPFFPLLWIYQFQYEFWSVVGNSACMAIGAYIFSNRWPDPWPSVFGYHEVFHVFTVLGFLFVYCCNWSVIHRTCNPYASQLDVRIIAWNFLFPSMPSEAQSYY
jgi:predicted membrane channel-forming protein YqfA (hemolysin III family)